MTTTSLKYNFESGCLYFPLMQNMRGTEQRRANLSALTRQEYKAQIMYVKLALDKLLAVIPLKTIALEALTLDHSVSVLNKR